MMEIKNYQDMVHMTADDILLFMAEQSKEDIEEFKVFCSTPVSVQYKDGSEKERTPVFFEIRRWVVDKYFPNALKSGKNGGKKVDSLLDRIMKL